MEVVARAYRYRFIVVASEVPSRKKLKNSSCNYWKLLRAYRHRFIVVASKVLETERRLTGVLGSCCWMLVRVRVRVRVDRMSALVLSEPPPPPPRPPPPDNSIVERNNKQD